MAIDFLHFSCHLALPDPARTQQALTLFQELRASDPRRRSPLVQGFDVALAGDPDQRTLWIHDDNGGSPDAVADFVLRLARQLDLKGRWGFEFARLSWRRGREEYGGGAIVLDLTSRQVLARIGTEGWLDGSQATWCNQWR